MDLFMVIVEALGKIFCDHPTQPHEFSGETLSEGSIYDSHTSHFIQAWSWKERMLPNSASTSSFTSAESGVSNRPPARPNNSGSSPSLSPSLASFMSICKALVPPLVAAQGFLALGAEPPLEAGFLHFTPLPLGVEVSLLTLSC